MKISFFVIVNTEIRNHWVTTDDSKGVSERAAWSEGAMYPACRAVARRTERTVKRYFIYRPAGSRRPVSPRAPRRGRTSPPGCSDSGTAPGPPRWRCQRR